VRRGKESVVFHSEFIIKNFKITNLMFNAIFDVVFNADYAMGFAELSFVD
jgi:hypothetical protein